MTMGLIIKLKICVEEFGMLFMVGGDESKHRCVFRPASHQEIPGESSGDGKIRWLEFD